MNGRMNSANGARMGITTILGVVLFGAVTGGSAAAHPSHAWLVIHHQTQGCHLWSVNDGRDAATQVIVLRRGGSISVTNEDVMPQKLVKTSGSSVTYTRIAGGGFSRLKTFPPDTLARQGSASMITFARAGVYRFTTKPGDFFMPNLETVGRDNILRLTVRVTA